MPFTKKTLKGNTTRNNEIFGFPRIIHMCHKSLDRLTTTAINWKKINPLYDIKLYDNELCEKFILENYPKKYRDIFLYINNGTQIGRGPISADFWRLCVLYKMGGIYTDADIEPLIPLDEYIERDVDLATCIVKGNYYNPHFIITNPYNKIIKNCLDKYVEKYDNNLPWGFRRWSIVPVFSNIMRDLKYKFKSDGIYFIDNMKIQLLQNRREGKNDGFEKEHSIYKNIRVFNNRYVNYKKR